MATVHQGKIDGCLMIALNFCNFHTTFNHKEIAQVIAMRHQTAEVHFGLAAITLRQMVDNCKYMLGS